MKRHCCFNRCRQHPDAVRPCLVPFAAWRQASQDRVANPPELSWTIVSVTKSGSCKGLWLAPGACCSGESRMTAGWLQGHTNWSRDRGWPIPLTGPQAGFGPRGKRDPMAGVCFRSKPVGRLPVAAERTNDFVAFENTHDARVIFSGETALDIVIASCRLVAEGSA